MAVEGDQPTFKTVRLDDGRTMAYAEYGDPAGRPVFWNHGTPSSRLVHPDEVVTAELGVRLIVPDRPGFGRSDFQRGRRLLDWPADVAQAADRLGIESFAVVGASGGGPYTVAMAYALPDRVTGAAILGGGGPFDAPGAAAGMTGFRRVGYALTTRAPWLIHGALWLAANPRRDPARFRQRFSAGMAPVDEALMAHPVHQPMFTASYAEAARQGLAGIAQDLRIFGQSWGFPLEEVRVPVHFWHGEQDHSTPPAMARYLADRIPGSRLTMLPDAGHLFFLETACWRDILTDLVDRS